MTSSVRLIDIKLQDEQYLGMVSTIMGKKPWEIRDYLQRKMHDNTKISLWEAVNKVEGKQYTLYELFIEKHSIPNQEKV
jgi:hypothetical protein